MMVLDNYLPADVFTALRTAIQAETFPWEASKVLSPRPKQLEAAYNFQYIHGFFFDKPGFKHRSDSFQLIEPIIQKLAPLELIKIKANKTQRQERQIEYGLHVDTRRSGATTAILYLNTNNGYTVFEDGGKVGSVENRLVLFDASRKHSGASCTDAECRLVLNINMIRHSTGG